MLVIEDENKYSGKNPRKKNCRQYTHKVVSTYLVDFDLVLNTQEENTSLKKYVRNTLISNITKITRKNRL